MISSIGDSSTASSLINAYLRELGGTRRGRAAAAPQRMDAAHSVGSVNGKSELTEEERRKVDELEKRDREVRRHETAHQAAAGQYAKGGPQLEFTRGPDGKQYATGGEVAIDTSEIPGDPQATIRKMQQIRQAATAPTDPSAQDRRVAAQAAQVEARARMDLRDSGGDVLTSSSPTSFAETVTSLFSDAGKTGSFVDVRA